MKARQVAALAGLVVVAGGTLSVTGGYAWYLHSDRYRAHCADVLSSSLGLPGEIGRVVPRTRRQREFRDVRVWLPQRRDEAAYCARALLNVTPTPTDPRAFELVLRGGRTEISTRTWLREDYRFVLESGLRPGFDPEGPRRVFFSGMDLLFDHGRFRFALREASGVVSFIDPHLGRAWAHCRELNGYRSTEDALLEAEFSPQAEGIRLDRVQLTVPELPIAIVGLRDLVGLDLRSGRFGGGLLYREHSDRRELTVRGCLYDVRLDECTASLVAQPWRGTSPEIELEELTLVDGQVQRLRFRGALRDVVLGDVLAPWGLGQVGGKLLLRVRAADLSGAGIERLIASGRCEALDLEQLSTAAGHGRMTGIAHVVIDDLTILDNRIAALDAVLRVKRAEGAPNIISGALLGELVERTLGLSLAALLPEEVPYSELGVRVEVRDEQLHVFGTHGPREKTILTINVGGQDVPLVSEPEQPMDLRAPLDRLRVSLLAWAQQRLAGLSAEEAWRMLARERAATRPAGADPAETE